MQPRAARRCAAGEWQQGPPGRRSPNGGFTRFNLFWDAADELGVIQQGGSNIYAAGYNGDGERVSLQDRASGIFPTQRDFTFGLGGLLFDTYRAAVYTPGIFQNVNGADTIFHTDWLGSTGYLSDSTGNAFPSALRHDAVGRRTSSARAFARPFRFGGGWRDQPGWFVR